MIGGDPMTFQEDTVTIMVCEEDANEIKTALIES